MTIWRQRFPILQQIVLRQPAFEVVFPLQVRTKNNAWAQLPFLLDTGSHLTTVPIGLADELQIPYTRDHRVRVQGTVGATEGFITPIWFAFTSLPSVQFEARCCFSAGELDRPLLGLTDVLMHFTLRTVRPSRLHPLGSVVVRLHKAHLGVPKK